MPTTVTIKEPDPGESVPTLCSLAIDAGFLDCDPLRNDPGNAGKPFLNRQLQPGDVVSIPDVDPKKPSKPDKKQNLFKKKNAPAVRVRFVHGTQFKPFLQDPTTQFLNLSNYITANGGPNGDKNFPTVTTFDKNGDVDLDAFKLEVVDPAGPAEVEVKLEALKPVYDAAGKLDHHEAFTGAEAGKRSVTVKAKLVKSKVGYRSSYLRLVVDPEDHDAVPDQTLLVTDLADGNAGDNDRMEILDQLVRASYVRQKCPGNPKCTAVKDVPIAPDKQRIKLCIHGVRAAVGGGATAIGGVTEQHLRRRTMKWFRRLYAQVQLSPQFVDPTIEFVDPPNDNMIVIGEQNGAVASGVNSAVPPSASTITFTLATSPPRAAADPPDPVVTVNLGGSVTPLTPGDVGARIAAALPAGFKAAVEVNCRATNAANGSCDILITRDDNKRVVITNEVTTDTGLLAAGAFAVCRVNLNQVNIDTPFAALLCNSMDVRRVLRTAPGSDGRLDFYVVGGLFGLNSAGVFGNAARGLAMIPGASVPADFQPKETMRFAALMGKSGSNGPVMDGGDHDPYSYPHEAGHVLHDGFHTKPGTPGGDTEMMTGDGTSAASAVDSSKRICDLPVKVIYNFYDPDPKVQKKTPGKDKNEALSAAARILTNGTSCFGAW